MPELPEVETVKRGLELHVKNTVITHVIVRQAVLRWPIPKNLKTILTNSKIVDIQRRAKYLLLIINSSEIKQQKIKKINGVLIIHLGMSGKLQIVTPDTALLKHDHVDIVLNNNKILRYNDPRRFGAILWSPIPQSCTTPVIHYLDNHERFKHLGPEPLTTSFNTNYIIQKARNRATPVKSFIMDNNIVVGVGNIYATESLFYAKINPTRAVSTIIPEEWQILINEIKKILKKAIKSGGTTLKDFTNSDGKPGYFKQELAAYGRSGEQCIHCNHILQTIRQQGRTTVFCSECQK
jgi:formamidopyrimidine-DNA glycosylase